MTADEFQALTGAWPERMADLEAFREMLVETNEVMNLVGPDSLPDFWNRHAYDSAQLLDLAPEARTWADLGAGAGLPGVVLAILLKGRAEEQALKVDIVTARAVAPLEKLLGYAQPYMSRGAQGLFLKGEKAEGELQEAAKVWHFNADLSVSRSDPRGRIVTVRTLRRGR